MGKEPTDLWWLGELWNKILPFKKAASKQRERLVGGGIQPFLHFTKYQLNLILRNNTETLHVPGQRRVSLLVHIYIYIYMQGVSWLVSPSRHPFSRIYIHLMLKSPKLSGKLDIELRRSIIYIIILLFYLSRHYIILWLMINEWLKMKRKMCPLLCCDLWSYL